MSKIDDIFKDIKSREYYIIKCENFIYYPKVVHVIGISMSCGDKQILCLTDDVEYGCRYNEIFYYDLIEFESYEQCKKRCNILNNLPRNKKRATEWNSPETQEKLRELASIRESESE